ncbi:unnamed protein product [Closterium sp. NIES-65]|nr:unnamed protein product [Closterium sp. NIES-65]
MRNTRNREGGEEGDPEEWQTVGPKQRAAVTRTHAVQSSCLSEIFGGQLRSEVRLAGSKPSATVQPFSLLQLDIASDRIRSVEEALKAFAAPEVVEGYRPSNAKENHMKENHMKENHMKENHMKENHMKENHMKENHMKENHMKENHMKENHMKENHMKENHMKENHMKENHMKENHMKENHMKENHMKENHMKENHMKENHMKENHMKENHMKENHMKECCCSSCMLSLLTLSCPPRLYTLPTPVKIHKPVSFPLSLTLSRDLLFSSSPSVEERRYSLFATVVHQGRDPSSGHYTADVRQPDGSWLRFDDARVLSVSAKRVLQEQAYLLLYQREGVRQ